MARLDRLLFRLARPADRAALRRRPGWLVRFRAIAGIALRYIWLYMLLFAGAAVLTVSAGTDIFHRTEMPRFCGACHEMDTNFATWERSQHGSIKCVDCHARPGISGWIAAKTAGTNQLLQHFTAESIEDISLKEKHKEIVSENCKRCHPGARRLNERRGLRIEHERHGKLGLKCVDCHAGNIAHPEEEPAPGEKVAGLVDIVLCFKCHDGAQKVGPEVAFNARDEDNCGKCHPDARFALAHGEGHASTKQRKPCLSCHDLPADKPHFALDRTNQVDLCRKCHAAPTGFVSTHKPFAEGKCADCHRVMAPSHLFRVGPKPTAGFCLGCHEDLGRILTAKNPEQLSAFANAEDKTDLHRYHAGELDDEPMWCSSCHAPHGSTAKRAMVKLIDKKDGEGDDEAVTPAYEATETGGTCSGSCHGDDTMEYERGRLPRKGGAR